MAYRTSLLLLSLLELPPYAYKARQAEAPEALLIEVQSVERVEAAEPGAKTTDVTVTARVQRVDRTKTGLRAGDVIRIRYAHRQYRQPRPGPSEVPILKEKQVCPAYLTGGGNAKAYEPAAGGYSFDTVK